MPEQPPLNPWRDPYLFIHASDVTYEALVEVLQVLDNQGVPLPSIGVLCNPFGHAMIFIVDLRDADERVEGAVLNSVPTAMRPSVQRLEIVVGEEPYEPRPPRKPPPHAN